MKGVLYKFFIIIIIMIIMLIPPTIAEIVEQDHWSRLTLAIFSRISISIQTTTKEQNMYSPIRIYNTIDWSLDTKSNVIYHIADIHKILTANMTFTKFAAPPWPYWYGGSPQIYNTWVQTPVGLCQKSVLFHFASSPLEVVRPI